MEPTLDNLRRLIAEAEVLAGGEHPCAVLGHKWKMIGGRACPFKDEGCGASQAVERCEACGEWDYGVAPGHPGYDWCASQHFDCGGRTYA